MTTILHQQAADLLETIWRGMPAEYKSRYRMSIWPQFEDQVRSAAYTTNLGRFVNSLCGKLGATIGSNEAERRQAFAVLETAEAGPLLKLMREETTLLVLMVHIRNQERREAWKEEPLFEEKEEENENLGL
jgi:hypothetical protein